MKSAVRLRLRKGYRVTYIHTYIRTYKLPYFTLTLSYLAGTPTRTSVISLSSGMKRKQGGMSARMKNQKKNKKKKNEEHLVGLGIEVEMDGWKRM